MNLNLLRLCYIVQIGREEEKENKKEKKNPLQTSDAKENDLSQLRLIKKLRIQILSFKK